MQKEESGILAGFWVRKIPESATVTAGYGKITNLRDSDIGIKEIRAEGFDTVEWHTSFLEDGIARMRKMDFPIPLPSGKEILLDKGGSHLMLIGKKKEISETLRIQFALSNGETLVWDAVVK